MNDCIRCEAGSPHHEAGPGPAARREFVHQRHPGAGLDQRAGILWRPHFDHRTGRDRLRVEPCLQLLAERRAALVGHQRIRRQRLGADRLPACQRMAGRTDQHHPGRADFLLFEVGMAGRQDGQRQVRLALEQALGQRRLGQVMKAELDLRMRLAVLGDRGGDEHLAQAGTGHQVQDALLVLEQVARHVVDALHAGVHGLDLVEQLARLQRGVQPAADALEQREADALLHVRQQPADGRLRHEQELGRAADRTGDHDGAEHFDLAQVKFHGDGPAW
ncbi:Uncharacterised protein [Bordetella pertussis]|nr:Uncharacterised protein [Bordetella pertussis]